MAVLPSLAVWLVRSFCFDTANANYGGLKLWKLRHHSEKKDHLLTLLRWEASVRALENASRVRQDFALLSCPTSWDALFVYSFFFSSVCIIRVSEVLRKKSSLPSCSGRYFGWRQLSLYIFIFSYFPCLHFFNFICTACIHDMGYRGLCIVSIARSSRVMG